MNNNSVPLFFDEHEWQTVEAAAARIIPTDHDPGAREAGVVVFIDRYLSGIDYIYANPWGSGFLRIDGRQAEAWTNRIADLQERYREGVRDLDRRSGEKFGSEFVTLTEEQQDSILETILPREVQAPANEAASSEREGEDTGSYGAPAPAPKKGGGVFGLKVAMSQPVTDENLGFAETLVLHTPLRLLLRSGLRREQGPCRVAHHRVARALVPCRDQRRPLQHARVHDRR
ncbi:hypothetical protein RKD54_000030 [Pseudarthrobacter sp. SLBN-100]